MKIPWGDGKRCFIIAEISANHGQNLGRALSLIKKAKKSGADAVKFQAYTPDTLTIDSDRKHFMIKHPKWGGRTLYDLYGEAYTPWGWFKRLKKTADDEGIFFFATAFDKTSVDMLEDIKVPIHKIASFELVDIPLIEYISKKKKPLIISTGMSSLGEMKEAVESAKRSGANDISLLKCVSSYPADPKEMNLRTIPDMKKTFKVPVGISDHSLSMAVPLAAVTLGANILEKHFTSSRSMKTPDSFFSLEPDELSELIRNIRVTEDALGDVLYGITRHEKTSLIFRRSLFVVADIKKGEAFTEKNVRSIRPSYGLMPKYMKKVLGKKAGMDLKRGMPLKKEHIKK